MCVCSLAYCNAWLQLVAATGKEGGKKTKALPVEASIQLKWFAIEYRKL